MNFTKHLELTDRHSFLSPSKYYWLEYDDDKLVSAYTNAKAKERGTELHKFAADCIRLGQKLPSSKKTLNMYVNTAIGYKMTPEQPLYYSENCFGTADAICFRNNTLRIHDYKSGTTPADMRQLLIYAALFCLEYKVDPRDIETELRIYQMDTEEILRPDAEVIQYTMDRIKHADALINEIKYER